MTPVFQDREAARLWRRHAAEIAHVLRAIDADQARALQAELERHLLDSVASRDPALSDGVRLAAAIAALGRPADYLAPLVGDRRTGGGALRRVVALKGGVFRSVLDVSRLAVGRAAFGFLCVIVLTLVGLAVLKPVWPSHVGLFVRGSVFVGMGALADVAGAREVLGWWFEPMALALALGGTGALVGLRRAYGVRAAFGGGAA